MVKKEIIFYFLNEKKLRFYISFATITAFSQFSKTHFIPPLSCSNSIGAADQYLYISTPTTTNVNFVITSNVFVASGTVSNNSPPYSIGTGNDGLITPKTAIGVVTNKRFRRSRRLNLCECTA
jgi:hypothetical protein